MADFAINRHHNVTLKQANTTIDRYEKADGGKSDGVLTQQDLASAQKAVAKRKNSSETLNYLSGNFNKFDTNHDGKLGAYEVKNAIQGKVDLKNEYQAGLDHRA